MVKAILWVCVIVGLGPVCLLAAYVSFGFGLAAWFKREFSGDGVLVYMAIPLEGFGTAQSFWPAVAVLLGSGMVVAGFAKMFSPAPETKMASVSGIPSLIESLERQRQHNPRASLLLSSGEFGPRLIIQPESSSDSFVIQIDGSVLTQEQLDAALGAIDSHDGRIEDDFTYRGMRSVRVRFPSRESATDYASTFFRDVAGLTDDAELHYFD